MNFPYRILFVRHGETAYNYEGRLQGQRDIALNAKGREQASAVGRNLRKLMGREIDALEAADAFVASPLSRTRETMELARAGMGLPSKRYALNDALKELTFGDWEGDTWPQIEARDPQAARVRAADKWNFRPPNGESYADLAERLTPWLKAQTKDMFVVSHGGVARCFMATLGSLPTSKAQDANIYQGRAIVFEAGGFRWVG